MRRRPVARVATGVAVGAVALTSVFAGTAWAPKIKTLPEDLLTREKCRSVTVGERPGYQKEGYDSLKECLAAARVALKNDRKGLTEPQ